MQTLAADAMIPAMRPLPQESLAIWLAAALASGVVAVLLFGSLGHPLLWNDEADTAVMAQRVHQHGLPIVSGEPSLAYHVRPEHTRAGGVYTAAVWGQYYLAAIGVELTQGIDDLYMRTAGLRLPFALTGFAALLLLAFGLAPLAGKGLPRPAFALVSFILTIFSVSLLLHLREARYYAPTVFATNLACVLYVRRAILPDRLPYVAWLLSMAITLFALFNFFPPASVSVAGSLVVALAWRSWSGSEPAKFRSFIVEASPIALAAGMSAAVFLSFDMLEQAQFVAAPASARSLVTNLGFAFRGLLRFEFLAPAVIAHIAVLVVHGQLRQEQYQLEPAARLRREASRFLLMLCALHVFLVCCMPLVWERYLIIVSPLLIAAFLLDATSLICFALPGRAAPKRGLAKAAVAASALVLLVSLGARVPELRGRIAEIREPVSGPLDYILPYLLDHRSGFVGKGEGVDVRPELIVATNYEGPAYTFYLGAHVIVGYYGQNLPADLAQVPDFIVPRPWPTNRKALEVLALKAKYERVEFPARRRRTNNPPMLWPDSPGRARHQFYDREPESRDDWVFLLQRVP